MKTWLRGKKLVSKVRLRFKRLVFVGNLQAINNFGIVSLKLFFFILALLKKAKESICRFVILVLLIINPKMILGKSLGSLNLAKA